MRPGRDSSKPGRGRVPGAGVHRGHEVMLDIPDPDLTRTPDSGSETHRISWWSGRVLRVPPSTSPVLERLVASGVRPISGPPGAVSGAGQRRIPPGGVEGTGSPSSGQLWVPGGRYGDLAPEEGPDLSGERVGGPLASDFHGRPHLSPSLSEARGALSVWGGGAQFGSPGWGEPHSDSEGPGSTPGPPPRRQIRGVGEDSGGFPNQREAVISQMNER